MTPSASPGYPRGEEGIRETLAEVRREVACRVCQGDIKRCRLAICPYLDRVRRWFEGRRDLQTTNLYGASPPSAFVGSWGYPKVLVGPLVPPVRDEDTSILDASESWLAYDLAEILRFRLSLVRGKAPRRVAEAREPDSILSTVQEGAMASKPIDTEMWFTKKPSLVSPFSARAAPSGPSADRIFSVGLLGTKERRRLVPTEWSITAVDDILAKALVDEVRSHPWIDEYEVYSASGLANNVAVLLFPQAFMFEGLEAWNLAADPTPAHDHEFAGGRTTYPDRIAGAYHATRLPVLEHLAARRRQAGAIVFMEVYEDWVPLGVWRYRELARAALAKKALRFSGLSEAEGELSGRLRLRLENWWRVSALRAYLRTQRRITAYA